MKNCIVLINKQGRKLRINRFAELIPVVKANNARNKKPRTNFVVVCLT